MRVELSALPRSFVAWWGRELAAALPAGLRRLLLPARTRLELTVEGRGLAASLVEGRTERSLADLPDIAANPPGARLRRRLRRAAREAAEVVLRLPAGRVLQPTLRLPLDAGEALDEVLAREMDRHTPFAAREVLFDWRVRGSDMETEQLFVDLLVARRADVREATAMLAATGLTADRIAGPAGDDAAAADFDLLRDAGRPRRRRPDGRLTRALAAGVAAFAVALALLALERRETELQALRGQVDELRAAAAGIDALEARLAALSEARAFLARRKLATAPAVAVLAEVTERLPDDAWVQGYAQTGDRLRLDGSAADASRLLDRLEDSPLLADVAFDAPVRRDGGSGGDRFSLVASVVGPGAPR